MSKRTMGESKLLLATILILIQYSESIYPPGCSYSQNLALNTDYFINNIDYPRNYTPGTDCLWVGTSPSGSTIRIFCQDVAIPTSTGCNADHLRVSLTGDSSFGDGKVYCGTGTLDLTTTTNRVAIELLATWNSPGGRLYCTLRATSQQPSCDCGLKKATRIVGGTPTGINEYPMMAGLIDVTVGAEVICGATIIAPRYVITAAHCFTQIAAANMGVLVGDWNISTGADTPSAKLYRVEWATAHPLFNYNAQTNDIGIVRTQTTIVFNLAVGPACLPFKYATADFTGQTVTYLGWGELFYNGPKPDVLYKVAVNVISNAQCQSQYSGLKTITSQQMCTYTPGKDACQGDSGGPALWTDSSNRLQLIGVTSFGYACNLKPGVDTKVSSYLSWITSMTPDAQYCVR